MPNEALKLGWNSPRWILLSLGHYSLVLRPLGLARLWGMGDEVAQLRDVAEIPGAPGAQPSPGLAQSTGLWTGVGGPHSILRCPPEPPLL